MNFQEAIKKVIYEHIKTALFIDENAREAFAESSVPELFEEKLSVGLHEEFAKYNIQLSTYKYNFHNYEQNKKRLFNGCDLVLLDWKLDGNGGEENALGVLSDIIYNSPKIFFCGIYTQEQPEVVYKNVLSYFSGITTQECENIRIEMLLEEEENYNRFKLELDNFVLNNYSEDRIATLKANYSNIFEKDFFQNGGDSFRDKLIKCWCAYSDYHKSTVKQVGVTSYDISDKVLLIGNTFIVILNKTTTKFKRLPGKFTQIISDYPEGFSLLMSIELKNIIENKSLMIDPRLCNIPQELFAYHKQQDKTGFDSFIKEVILSGVSLSLLDEQLYTIHSLPKIPNTYKPKIEELLNINFFYNSIQRTGSYNLTFGDIFKCNSNSNYYICITPLCDCANPKNENTFYFAKGHKVEEQTIKKDIKRSEEVFVSYLPNNVMIRWADSSDKGKPIYITPIPLTIPKPIVKNNILNACHLKAKISQKEKFVFEYVCTLKQNYAQRIANHAFAHSIRVGISFFPTK
ncbi:MAG: hypothetical protein IJB46_06300 [Prevotella sp.]|nr:hypothetical protein [Prevotella sp.]